MNFFYEKRSIKLDFAQYDRLNFPLHMHNEIEIAVLCAGESNCIVDKNTYHLRSGDAVAIFPNQLHGFYGDTDVSTILLIFDPMCFPSIGRTFGAAYPRSPFFPKDELDKREFVSTVKFLLEEYEKYGPAIAEACVGFILGKLLIDCEMVTNNNISATEGELFQKMLRYCTDNYKQDIRLEDVIRHLNISRSYASHLFMKNLNTPFRSYINALRINEACTLLKFGDKSCSEVAFECGFSTIRTFNRCFQQMVGSTPKDYRNERHRIIKP